MNPENEVFRDERTTVVEDRSYKWAYMFVTYGVLAICMYRSLIARQSVWDLLCLAAAGGVVGTLYQARHHILTKRSFQIMAVAFLTSAIVAAAIALFVSRFSN